MLTTFQRLAVAVKFLFYTKTYVHLDSILDREDFNMIKRIMLTLILLTSIIIVFFCYIVWFRYGVGYGLTCVGQVDFYKEGNVMKVTNKLHIDHDKRGTISINGNVFDIKGNNEQVARTVNFSYENFKNRYILKPDGVYPSIDEHVSNETLAKWFPQFYVNGNKKTEIFIDRISFSSLLVSGEFLPFYVCAQLH